MYITKNNLLKLASSETALSQLKELGAILKETTNVSEEDMKKHQAKINLLAYNLKYTLSDLGD